MADATIDLGNVVGPSGDGINGINLVMDEVTRTLTISAERTKGGVPITANAKIIRSLIAIYLNDGENTPEALAQLFPPAYRHIILDLKRLELWRAEESGWTKKETLQRYKNTRTLRNTSVTMQSGWTIAQPLQWHLFPGGVFALFGSVTHSASISENTEPVVASVVPPDGCTVNMLCAGPASSLNWFVLKGDNTLVFRCNKSRTANEEEAVRIIGLFSTWNYN